MFRPSRGGACPAGYGRRSRWLRAVRDLTGRQIIFATHMGDVFGKTADNILYVQNDFGKSIVRPIDFSELAMLQLDDDGGVEDGEE